MRSSATSCPSLKNRIVGDPGNSKLGREAHVFANVKLADACPANEVRSHLVDQWLDHFAGFTAFSPDVDDNRELGLFNFISEVGFGDSDDGFVCHGVSRMLVLVDYSVPAEAACLPASTTRTPPPGLQVAWSEKKNPTTLARDVGLG